MAKAKIGDKVQVHYTGTLDDGLIFDYTGEFGHVICEPIELAIGREDDLLPKFHEALIGLEPGERVKVRIACEDAYGERSEEKVFKAPRSEFDPDEELCKEWRYPNNRRIPSFNPRRGERMEICLPDGTYIPAILSKVTKTMFTFDANHPWAGKDLNFDIKLVKIL